MRLAIITHNINKGDGQGRVNYEIARFALAQGYQVWLLANWVEPDLKALGATWIPLKPHRWRFSLPIVMEFVQLANRAVARLESEIDIIHAFGYVLSRPHHVNTSQFVHSAWQKSPEHDFRARRNLYGAYQGLFTLLNARWERRAYRQAQVVVAASDMVRQELRDIGVSSQRLRVITNGVDPAEFRPGPAERAGLGLPAGVPLALFVGDIRTSRKNLATVLRALPHAPGVHLAVVGEVRGSPYPRLAKSLGVGDRVHFLGFRRDVAQIMRAVDLFVFLSRYEPFGIVVLEALASGLPVITASSVGAANLVRPDCGMVLDNPLDAPALAIALQKLMPSPEQPQNKPQTMRAAARQVAEHHSWRHMAGAYAALYRELAPGGSQHSPAASIRPGR